MSSAIFILLLPFISIPYSLSIGSGPPPGLLKGPGPSIPKPGPSVPKPGHPTPPTKGPVPTADPNSVFKSFLACLPTQSPHPDPSFSSIVFSSATNASAYTKTLEDRIRNRRFNMTSTPKPAIIVTPTKEFHVQATVLCAKKLDLQIKIRSGGHDYEAISSVSSEETFMILDMFNLRSVEINIPTETAVVQAGAQLGELYYRIWEKSKVHGFPSGVCPTIGIGGHISGAGYGNMIRKYGLSIDHVIDAKIVNVDGKILDRKAMGEDLFWAVRGGGGSSFGVILSFTLKLVPVPKITTVFRLEKGPEPNVVDVIMKWQEIMPKIDNDLFIRLLLTPVPVNGKKTIKVTFVGFFLGDSSKLLGLMSKAFPELGLKKENCSEVSWLQSTLYWAELDIKKPEILLDRSTHTIFFKAMSDFVQTPIQKQGWTTIFNKLMDLGSTVVMGFNPYGGKMSEIPANATAMPHRAGNLYKIQYFMPWMDGAPKVMGENLKKGKAFYKFMTPYVSKNPRCVFTNYRDFDVGVNSGDGFNSGKVYGEKFFKGNFERLVKVKTAVDPEDFFRHEQSIPTQGKKP
ncbi:putative tetrahydroberberine oxidase [Helianthus annuus]|uniref:Putative berberine/berberine-like, Xanthine dehydrogenase, small subunit, FAD-binding, type 2 n=1 Tax=Helianthus annuus TaxID=4232 RepID=A0A251U2A3_HELAN|nr:berberine bridge enzyme-like 2 [Helianthus annuus]KAF5794007.1 putative tetrahydroberberine oxidase [Helianthus annuus]KAJ0721254.1 putative tetrahydroberberine oxidase [Helianthus annuus]KAJ0896408.1 putative tetrahydroberberine oxidase [Helianthus annuus]